RLGRVTGVGVLEPGWEVRGVGLGHSGNEEGGFRGRSSRVESDIVEMVGSL
ncbi:hypothetical protein HK097_009308, partial [Rhizophlyctis rosea]